MAPSVTHLAAVVVLAAISLISPSQSATCTSQSFNNNKRFSFCNDLPQLDSFLHWTYTPAQSTLSIAFIAPPPTPGGWISWAINPTSTGMVGSQALVASRDNSGALVVTAYNITAYDRLEQSGVWFQVKKSSAEFSGGVITLFATLILPASCYNRRTAKAKKTQTSSRVELFPQDVYTPVVLRQRQNVLKGKMTGVST